MGRKEENIKKATEIMNKPKYIRNIGIAAHIDHGKTTLSDNLIAGAGMMSEELAGEQLLLDFDEQEQDRGITINAANASMVHHFEGNDYLINLIDTPGHVDFGGDVTRAMRAVDGCIVVVCAVEGIMPQTETVIRQALKEKARPTLFINKVDRLINELQVTPEQMQERFVKIIAGVNDLIKKFAPDEYKEIWQCKVEDGTVAFGSAKKNWGISVPYMEQSGISFKDIYDYCAKDDQKTLAQKSKIHEILLDMVVDNMPSPEVAQRYRIPHIWHGEADGEIGQAMINCRTDSATVLMVTKIWVDPHAGEIATGRLYGGTIKKGQELLTIGMPGANRVQQVGFFVGPDRIPVESVVAGNIVAVSGLKNAIAGSTVTSDPEVEAFEQIKHYSEPVVTVAVEAKHMKDLPKLIEVLRIVAKADPSIQIEINQETGEHLMSGMGELHLEITEYRIVHEHGVDIQSSEPIVVYRESVEGQAGPFEGKSPNKHNHFYIEIEPLDQAFVDAIKNGDIPTGRIKNSKEVARTLVGLGMSKEEAKGIYDVHNNNIFLNVTKGIQYLHETRELLVQAFHEAMDEGPRAREPVNGIKIRLVDAKLHEDAIHRGPAQVIPAARTAIHGAIVSAGNIILEPKMKVFINVPQELMGAASREIQQRRSNVEDMKQEGELVMITALAPVAEMFGFASAIRSATQGKALWTTEFSGFEKLPKDLLPKVTAEVRTRKGLKPEPQPLSYYMAA
jgi:elongation factor 2